MSIPYPKRTTNDQFCPLAVLRLERAVARLAAQRGYWGDPLAEPVPAARTLGDVCAADELYLDIPADLRGSNRDLATQMCRAAVFGSGQSVVGQFQAVPTASASASATSKLARERARHQSRRAAG